MCLNNFNIREVYKAIENVIIKHIDLNDKDENLCIAMHRVIVLVLLERQ